MTYRESISNKLRCKSADFNINIITHNMQTIGYFSQIIRYFPRQEWGCGSALESAIWIIHVIDISQFSFLLTVMVQKYICATTTINIQNKEINNYVNLI